MKFQDHLPLRWAVVLSATLGFIAVIVPPYLLKSSGFISYDAPLFPFVRSAIENLRLFPTVILLFAIGVFFGVVYRKRCIALAFATMLFFPVYVIAEVLADPASHGLWPFEIIMYIALIIPAMLGVALSRYFVPTG
jgi:hypothetical protein